MLFPGRLPGSQLDLNWLKIDLADLTKFHLNWIKIRTRLTKFIFQWETSNNSRANLRARNRKWNLSAKLWKGNVWTVLGHWPHHWRESDKKRRAALLSSLGLQIFARERRHLLHLWWHIDQQVKMSCTHASFCQVSQKCLSLDSNVTILTQMSLDLLKWLLPDTSVPRLTQSSLTWLKCLSPYSIVSHLTQVSLYWLKCLSTYSSVCVSHVTQLSLTWLNSLSPDSGVSQLGQVKLDSSIIHFSQCLSAGSSLTGFKYNSL